MKQWKKHLGILQFYKCLPWHSYDIWFLRYGVQQTELFVILGHFLPFYPTKTPKYQNFEKMKKKPSDIIILRKSMKNADHIPYCSWDMGHERCNFYFHFGLFFVLYPPNNPENQHLEKMKKISGDIIILHMRVINDNQMMCGSWDNQMMCGSWDMERNRQNFLSIRTIFCPFTLLTSQKIKFWKNEKNKTKKQQLEILPFYTCVP